jgi:pilus assembly protein CpaE
VETAAATDVLFRSLNDLAEVCDPNTKVVIIGHNNDVTLYRELIKNGISEYMVAPVTIADLMNVVHAVRRSGSRTARPLGRLCRRQGRRRLLDDCAQRVLGHLHAVPVRGRHRRHGPAFGTANINFDQDPAQGIAEAVFSSDRIDEVYLDRLLAKLRRTPVAAGRAVDARQGLRFRSGCLLAADRCRPAVTRPMSCSTFRMSGTAGPRRTLEQADEVVVVASPELANLRNTKNVIDTLRKLRPNDFARA